MDNIHLILILLLFILATDVRNSLICSGPFPIGLIIVILLLAAFAYFAYIQFSAIQDQQQIISDRLEAMSNTYRSHHARTSNSNHGTAFKTPDLNQIN